MSKHVQIRSIADSTHRQLKIRASQQGMSMSDYLKRLIERDLKRPTWEDARALMEKLAPISLPESSADMIRRERDSR